MLLYLLPFILNTVYVVLCEDAEHINFIVEVLGGKKLCGGALITRDCVVTSAKCVANTRQRDLSVKPAFLPSFLSASQDFRVKAKTILIHAKYVAPAPSDIAIIKLQTYINSLLVKTINGESEQLAAGTTCQVAGWGRNYSKPKEKSFENKTTTINSSSEPTEKSIENEISNSSVKKVRVRLEKMLKGRIKRATALKEQTVRVIHESKCQVRLVKNMHVCAMTVNGTDICFDDSRGFLICNHKLAGISSLTSETGCGTSGNHSVFTNISRYSGWIKKSGCTGLRGLGMDWWGGGKPIYGTYGDSGNDENGENGENAANEYFKDINRISPFFSSYCLVLILAMIFS